MVFASYANQFEFDTDGSGDPIIVDAQTGATMATWDRSEGAWIPATIGTAADPVPGTSYFTDTEHESVSTEQASINAAASVNPRQFVTSIDRTTTTVDLSVISEWGVSYGTVVFEGFLIAETGASSSWWVRVNGISTADYTTISRSGASLSSTSDDKWVLATQSSGIRAVPVTLQVAGKSNFGDAGRITASVGHDTNALMYGDVTTTSDVTSLEFGSTDANLNFSGAVYLAGPY